MRRVDDDAREGAAIGGVNLFGPPDERGAVEFAFGLVPAARGEGLARHVVEAALDVLRDAGVSTARAECEIANLPARRTLEQAGLVEVARVDGSVLLEARL
ncbi:hypothetical protein GCM10025870_18910 [Agromyces marinus]|uniref:N-acetyltransferase domain-containing protein n=1 Tax=Agromyces marinus TaxID=1389020 RepID=A0ABN6YHA6_9MICO|nr:GNAT family N-acetyltransferase [Agromyces marinus]BDZ54818.1 hypothetical protein GCM10025870_18910 [Agromyces marinus]